MRTSVSKEMGICTVCQQSYEPLFYLNGEHCPIRKYPKQREYRDFTASEYKAMRCTSYTGGAAWLKGKDGFIVVACTPVEILKYFNANPNSTVRGEFIAFEQVA